MCLKHTESGLEARLVALEAVLIDNNPIPPPPCTKGPPPLKKNELRTNRDVRVFKNDVSDSVREAPAVVRQNPGIRRGAGGGGRANDGW
jgi:hypothetical protein